MITLACTCVCSYTALSSLVSVRFRIRRTSEVESLHSKDVSLFFHLVGRQNILKQHKKGTMKKRETSENFRNDLNCVAIFIENISFICAGLFLVDVV